MGLPQCQSLDATHNQNPYQINKITGDKSGNPIASKIPAENIPIAVGVDIPIFVAQNNVKNTIRQKTKKVQKRLQIDTAKWIREVLRS